MTSRALLIGAQLEPLQGIERDLDIMQGLLGNHGFTDVRRVGGATATRTAIITAFADLVDTTDAGDAVAVYYTGHGGSASDTTTSERVQYLTTIDYPVSAPGDFRGITRTELALLVAAIVRKTPNVSVILDCCYAALMARDPASVEKAVPGSPWIDIAAHNTLIGTYLLQRGLQASSDGFDRAVVLAASRQRQMAKEITSGNRRVGALTQALDEILAELGSTSITWAGLLALLGPRVGGMSEQQPQVDGPTSWTLFTTTPADITGVLRVRPRQGYVELDGGTLAGVAVGDRYGVVPPGDSDLSRLAATLTITSVTAVGATADSVLEPGVVTLLAPADARPISRTARRRLVAVADDPALDAVRAAMAGSVHVEAVAPRVAGEPVLAGVEIDAGGVVLGDGVGPIVGPVTADGRGATLVVQNLDRLARAAAARALEPGTGGVDDQLGVRWGRVISGKLHDLETAGETLFLEDRIFVALRNAGPTMIYVHVFSIDGGGGIARLAQESTTGISLAADQEYIIGKREDQNEARGRRLLWPDDVRTDLPRPESLLVIATRYPVDLRMLTQSAVQGSLRIGATPLEEQLWQLVGGGDRAVREPDGRTAVRYVDYLLVPARRPGPEETLFLLDERPDISVGLLATRPKTGTTTAVDVRIDELRVRRTHPFHGLDLRLDVLLVTAPSVAGDPPEHAAVTVRLPASPAGIDVVLADHLVRRGNVRDVLDLAMWLSRDVAGGADLDAVLAAPAAPGDDEPMASAAAALEAVRGLVDAADAAVRASAQDTVAVYRGSFAVEALSGPHPAGALGAQQEIGLRYSVDVV